MKATLDNVMLKITAEDKAIIGKKMLVFESAGPEVRTQFKKGQRVYLDGSCKPQELNGIVIVKESDIICYEQTICTFSE